MYKKHTKVYWAIACSLLFASPSLALPKTLPASEITQADPEISIVSVSKINPTTVELLLSNKQRISLDFYGNNIFRVFQDNHGGIIRDPEAKPAAQILVDNPRKPVEGLTVGADAGTASVETKDIRIEFNKANTTFKVYNKKNNQLVLETAAAFGFDKKQVNLKLIEHADEYFYGGGVQNGRFSHKGKSIAIENTNSWTDGGVASPTPYFWSTKGYSLMWYSFKKGRYDFGNKEKSVVNLTHDTDYLDVFLTVSDSPVGLLNDFYQLTGHPVLIPKFGFYQGHLNAYNRDYWKEDEKGILFEDGKRYKESQKNEGGTKESLNGEKGNYQFSARAVIDRYKQHDMPLGWVLPNDGYGAGYGQTETLDGNIQNLKDFGEYARQHGVEIGLWTQSDLHPKDSIGALLQRDIVKEVRDAGVRVLKTDVAWVGAGYSFGLNGVADVGHIMPYYGNDARPFIISLDGWAGTQRYAGIWSGDQTGGVWEYIRFHIPTYIGSGLSGQPNITSDLDGIFGGKNNTVNTRDFQWKTFTPMELNMDGWGSNEKYPHALGEPIASINRHYLKWKSELMPYAYSIAKEAIDGKPMIRAMFLDYPNAYTFGSATQYQFLYGPSILVAPIYQETKMDSLGNDIRNGIYLPEGQWVDYYTGEQYAGNSIINNYQAPIWKLPVFVKRGAIIPLVNPNNNVKEINSDQRIYEIYPLGKTIFNEYDDDGLTQAYQYGQGSTTCIDSELDAKGNVKVTVFPAVGEFEGMLKDKSTEFRINATAKPKRVNAYIGRKKVKLQEVNSLAEFESSENVYFYEAEPNLNQFATAGSEFAKVKILKNPVIRIKLAKVNTVEEAVTAEVQGYVYEPANSYLKSTGALATVNDVQITDANTKPYTLAPTWTKQANADYYEISFQDMLYSHIQDSSLVFDGLKPETAYQFKIRSVNKDGASEWKEFQKTTKSNPLQFAITGISATSSAPTQGGGELSTLFDFDEGNMWHTKWGQKAVPFDVVIDLHSFNQLDKFHYLPRSGKGNGILLKGKVYSSSDKINWTLAGDFEWENTDAEKHFEFKEKPNARYIKMDVTQAVGDFGSGREIYVFKVPGTESYRPGDINNDRLIDRNDLTSYTNYTGLRMGDADFEGYVSNGDINKNGLIDAYDISVVASQLDGGVEVDEKEKLAGSISISPSKANYAAGEQVEIHVKADKLSAVNALSFALPYSTQDYEFVGIDNLLLKQMENMSNDRLHTNGQKALYPTFVNVGNQQTVNAASGDLFIIKLKAKRAVKFNLKPIDGILVDKSLNTLKF